MTILTAPVGRLADHVVTLRLPSPDAGDVATVDNYIQEEQLDGGWLPDVPLVTGRQLVADWLDGWAGHPSRNGPAFVVTVPQHSGFIGVIGMNERDDGTVEISYGIAPHRRRRGVGHSRRLPKLAMGRLPKLSMDSQPAWRTPGRGPDWSRRQGQ